MYLQAAAPKRREVSVGKKRVKVIDAHGHFVFPEELDVVQKAVETLNVAQGPEPDGLPSGSLIMNKDDHQGRTSYYLLKVNGQKEEVVQTFAPDALPLIGDCKIGG